ncbi:lytic transglycosylase domain-containing protein [Pseudoxanthomonas sp. JBR18]|uniref:lytic transglycosylase domain-containing protein n=1 Tax=Pseudoxanthomonas sp. JBR18 TaxID=2969308 RepID=UPI002FE4069C
MDMMQCQNLAVSPDVMQHVVQVESAANPYAIGVVGGRLVRQPESLAEAVATAEMLEQRGYNFSVGLAQVNRHNLGRFGISDYTAAFDKCTNLRAGSQILSECRTRAAGDWGKAFSCYYSGNFSTGFQHGYVQKIVASIRAAQGGMTSTPVALAAASSSAPERAERTTPRRVVEDLNDTGPLAFSAPAVMRSGGAGASPRNQSAALVNDDPGAHAGEVVHLTPGGPRYADSAGPAVTQAPRNEVEVQAAAGPLQANPAGRDSIDAAFVF